MMQRLMAEMKSSRGAGHLVVFGLMSAWAFAVVTLRPPIWLFLLSMVACGVLSGAVAQYADWLRAAEIERVATERAAEAEMRRWLRDR